MTGPEHYTEAEYHLNAAQEADNGSEAEQYNLAAAQVHATLAQAAATMDATRINPEDWMAVLDADNA